MLVTRPEQEELEQRGKKAVVVVVAVSRHARDCVGLPARGVVRLAVTSCAAGCLCVADGCTCALVVGREARDAQDALRQERDDLKQQVKQVMPSFHRYFPLAPFHNTVSPLFLNRLPQLLPCPLPLHPSHAVGEARGSTGR